MGLASKIKAGGSTAGAAAPSAPNAHAQQQPQQQPQQGVPPPYGAPPSNQQFGAPPSSQYGAPQGAPPSYGAHQTSQYGAPSTGQYGAPPTGQYGAPPTGQYGAPPTGQYGAPPTGQYGAPPTGQYGAPPTGQYGAPLAQHGQYGQQQQQQQWGGPHQQPQGHHQYSPTQQQQYGAPQHQQAATPQAPFGVSGPVRHDARTLETKLRTIVTQNRLEGYYDATRFNQVLQRVTTVDFGAIITQWKLQNLELAYDLAPLALYDIVFYCDDSGSMACEEGGERIEDLKEILAQVSSIATLFDDDGVVVRFMNSNVNGDGIRSRAEVQQLISQVRFTGMTPLGTNLDKKIIQPMVVGPAMSGTMSKPVLVICITDGEPSGESQDTIMRVIRQTKDALSRTRYGPGGFAIEIAQVGKDTKTQKFLAALDNDPVVGTMVDCTSYYEMEAEEFLAKNVTLTPELWLLKICVAAIDRTYDDMD